MATVIGYEGNVWLVVVLLMLVLGLAGAVVAATRSEAGTMRAERNRPITPGRPHR